MAQPPLILAVDDNDHDLYLIRQVFGLLRPSCRVETFNDSRSLITFLRQSDQLPSLILVDWHMPDLDGIQVVEEVRRSPRLFPVPVFLLSSDLNPTGHFKALDNGATGFLIKPANFTEWNQLVERLAFSFLDDQV
ncbi:hypothetical protein GCM10023189_11690 [Nibrella saemangeumensis]|uniref:Response regulatory domain-containing protein n=1 Tax=Nibrella saemangeumensis TaxID=1084526 RepID=A0ABP8MHI9_9BACT